MAIQESLRLFFTSGELDNIDRLPKRVQEHYCTRYQGVDQLDELELKILKLIAEVVPLCKDRALAEDFFLTLDKGSPEQTLKKLSLLKKICQEGQNQRIEALLQCAVTRKKEYYNTAALSQMIEAFDSLKEEAQRSLPTPFPPYEAGGRELLLQLKWGICVRGAPSRLQRGMWDSFYNASDPPQKIKTLALQLLQLLPEKQRVDLELYRTFFNKILTENKLRAPSKAFLIKLTVLTTTVADKKSAAPLFFWDDFQELLAETVALVKVVGEEGFEAIAESFLAEGDKNFEDLRSIISLVTWFGNQSGQWEWLKQKLQSIRNREKKLNAFLSDLEECFVELRSQMPVGLPSNIEVLLKRFELPDPRCVQYPLSKDKIECIKKQYQAIHKLCVARNGWHLSRCAQRVREIQKKGKLNEEDIHELMASAYLVIRIKFQIDLHPTQILAVLALLACSPRGFAQIKTGEGKTFDVTLLAFIMVMHLMRVHIVTSSRPLAIRDQRQMASFFHIFAITTDHICEDQRAAQHYQAQIIYGTAYDYEFSLMREMLYSITLFPPKRTGEQPFDCVIVDEMDNLTIDTASDSARLSMQVETTFEWIYHAIYRFISREQDPSFPSLCAYLREHHATQFTLFTKEQGILKGGKKLMTLLGAALYVRDKCHVKEDYVLLPNEEGEIEVVIVDKKNTGQLKISSRWSYGIHEFIEVKHDLKVRRESRTPISLSHAVFYSLYECFFGLSGTAGSEGDRETLKEVYQVEIFDVPTEKPPQREDLPIRFFPERTDLLVGIKQRIEEMKARKRPSLILCESIEDSESVAKFLQDNHITFELLNELQEKGKDEILEGAGHPGALTVATNNAARGEDIRLRKESESQGGLYVLFIFYPESDRGEGQGRGRAGRQGQPGTSEIYLAKDRLKIETKGLSDDEIVQKLTESRKEKAKSGHLALRRGKIEKELFKKAKQFFERVNHFHRIMTEEKTLRSLAERLAYIKLPHNPAIPSTLSKTDRRIAEEAVALLRKESGETAINSWYNLLNIAAERITERCRLLWTTFYEEAEESLNQRDLLQLDELFNQSKIVWERYFQQEKDVFLHYLSSITAIDLKDLLTRR